MKKMIGCILALALSGPAFASPYFRVLRLDQISSYQPVGGSFVDPRGNDANMNGAMIPLVYHSHQDGYWLIPGEDWSLLNVGGAAGPRGNVAAIGPMWNVLQSAEWLGLQAANYALPSSWLQNVKAQISQPQTSSVDLSAAIGPTFVYDPNGNKGYFRIFFGGSLHF